LGFAARADAASSIGINFSAGQSNAANVTPLAATDTTGVIPQQNWNNAGGTGLNGNGTTANVASPTPGVLVDNTAAATTAAITWTSTNSWSISNAARSPADAQLLNGYLDNTSAATPTTVTVTGIPYAQYDVYAYVGSDGNGRTGHVSIGGSTFYFSTNANNNPPSFTLATATDLASATSATYARFAGLSSPAFTLTNTRDSNNVGLNGIQIVQVVPEPTSLGLLAVGGAGLMARRRRRQA
jgi:hypothetical protein